MTLRCQISYHFIDKFLKHICSSLKITTLVVDIYNSNVVLRTQIDDKKRESKCDNNRKNID